MLVSLGESMFEEWWREIAGAVGITAFAFWTRKFLSTPSRIDRELTALNKTISSMNEAQHGRFDEFAEYMRESREQLARQDERIKALEHK